MSAGRPALFADHRRIWIEEHPSRRSGILWEEIMAVAGYKLDLKSETLTLIELDHPSGHWFELHSTQDGFITVVAAITANLPGIARDWLEVIDFQLPTSISASAQRPFALV